MLRTAFQAGFHEGMTNEEIRHLWEYIKDEETVKKLKKRSNFETVCCFLHERVSFGLAERIPRTWFALRKGFI